METAFRDELVLQQIDPNGEYQLERSSNGLWTVKSWSSDIHPTMPTQEELDQAELAITSLGLRADWESFVKEMPEIDLVVLLIQNRKLTVNLHNSISDLMHLMAIPQLRTPALIGSFWQEFLEELATLPLMDSVPNEVKEQWNAKIDEHELPQFMKVEVI